ncbi:hypothetical protein LINPERHAP1_LOCUS30139 [Linum perenne]
MAPAAQKSSGGDGDSVRSKSWASVVSQPEDDLRFVEESLGAVVDGILKIPMAVIEKGVAKLKRAVVGQFAVCLGILV